MATRGKQDLPSARSGRASATREEARGGGWRAAVARFLYPVRSKEQTAWYFGTADRTAVGPLVYVKLSKFRLDKPNSFSLGVDQRADTTIILQPSQLAFLLDERREKRAWLTCKQQVGHESIDSSGTQ